jgi:hypothetical protein
MMQELIEQFETLWDQRDPYTVGHRLIGVLMIAVYDVRSARRRASRTSRCTAAASATGLRTSSSSRTAPLVRYVQVRLQALLH